MSTKRLTVGDKVKFVIEYRTIKKGKTEEEYYNELRQIRREKKLTSEDYNNILDKYYQKKIKTKSGISEIIKVDNYYHNKDKELPIFYTLANNEIVSDSDIERIPIHQKFSELLNKSYRTDSFFTRSGLFYRIGDTIILEYITSTKNVWVDKLIAEQFDEEEYKDIEKEIRSFFNDKVKNVSFGLELNNHVNTLKNSINQILKEHNL